MFYAARSLELSSQTILLLILVLVLGCKVGPEEKRITYHRSMAGPAIEFGQDTTIIPSVLVSEDGVKIDNAEKWIGNRRPEIIKLWKEVLGKLGPLPTDEKWFGDVTEIITYSHVDKGDYISMHIGIPIEIDFYQDHLLLLPKDLSKGPFPAVIAWSATSSDFREPEQWWGSYLVRNGYIVLTSWSFIRNYRDGTNYKTDVHEKVYERFGHWLPMAKMVHDVQREVEYLQSIAPVDPEMIGFIGFSLSAKAAVYVAAFLPEIKVTISIDPHIAINGSTNWYAPWYLDWRHAFPEIHTEDYPVEELRGTVQSLLNPNLKRPGFERNHHELMALCAPRAFMLIGGNCDKEFFEGHSDDLQSRGYVNRAKEVYELLGHSDRFEFVETTDGHNPNGPKIDQAWKSFFNKWLKTSTQR